jgi:hypothetical protein
MRKIKKPWFKIAASRHTCNPMRCRRSLRRILAAGGPVNKSIEKCPMVTEKYPVHKSTEKCPVVTEKFPVKTL